MRAQQISPDRARQLTQALLARTISGDLRWAPCGAASSSTNDDGWTVTAGDFTFSVNYMRLEVAEGFDYDPVVIDLPAGVLDQVVAAIRHQLRDREELVDRAIAAVQGTAVLEEVVLSGGGSVEVEAPPAT